MVMKKWLASAVAATLIVGSVTTAALAFNDLNDVPKTEAEKIEQLRERGIVSGMDKDHFAPHQILTAQQAIPLIVKSMQLSLAKFLFMKQPEASDSFTKLPNDAWYAEAFVIAHVNGVPIDRDVNPNAPVTREQFVHWLMSALDTTGEYAFIEMYMMLEDESKVSNSYMDSIQRSLVSGIAELDKDKKFRPQEPITRAEAAVMASNALHFVEDRQSQAQPVENPIETGEIQASTEAVNTNVKKLTLSWGEKPHSGWSIKIEGVDFLSPTSAVIRYSLHYPDPAAMYAQVITEPKASTYLDASITDIQYELVFSTNQAIPERPLEPNRIGETGTQTNN
jgi:hypothetical protein